MTRTVFAALLLSLSVAACDSTPTETNSNANTPTKVAETQVSPTPSDQPTAPIQSPASSPSAKALPKAGDKVRVATNGSFADATVVSVDEKARQVTVKMQGESKEKTVALSDVTRQ